MLSAYCASSSSVAAHDERRAAPQVAQRRILHILADKYDLEIGRVALHRARAREHGGVIARHDLIGIVIRAVAAVAEPCIPWRRTG